MKSNTNGFNIYLALTCLFLVAGCASKSSKFAKNEQSTLRLYLEGNRGDPSTTGTVLVTRQRIPYTIDREPSLTEADLRKAALLEEPGPNGGYAIQLVFNEHGALLLDMLTTANKGRHLVVFAQFPPKGYKAPKAKRAPKKSEDDNSMEDLQATLPPSQGQLEAPGQPRASGWLGAVLIRGRNPSGMFTFSPDASREEAARIVRGLKNDIAYAKSVGN
jgi:hypothetical protein